MGLAGSYGGEESVAGYAANWDLVDPYVPAAARSGSDGAVGSPEGKYGGAGLWVAASVAGVDYSDAPGGDAGPSAVPV